MKEKECSGRGRMDVISIMWQSFPKCLLEVKVLKNDEELIHKEYREQIILYKNT